MGVSDAQSNAYFTTSCQAANGHRKGDDKRAMGRGKRPACARDQAGPGGEIFSSSDSIIDIKRFSITQASWARTNLFHRR